MRKAESKYVGFSACDRRRRAFRLLALLDSYGLERDGKYRGTLFRSDSSRKRKGCNDVGKGRLCRYQKAKVKANTGGSVGFNSPAKQELQRQ